jgi:SAM-dependent methyltransferase/acyl carrier protein
MLHPLAQRNISTLNAQRFTSRFDGGEFFFADHMVEGCKMLSAAACLEMARSAVEQSLAPRSLDDNGNAVPMLRFSEVVWTRPVTIAGGPKEVQVAITGNPSGPVRFEIQTPPDAVAGAALVHGQGVVEFGSSIRPEPIDLEAVRAESPLQFSAEQCYSTFADLGIDYGPSHRGMNALCLGPNQIVAKLQLPESVAGTIGQFVLHPSLLDAAFQATIGFGLSEAGVKPANHAVTRNGNGKPELDLPARLQPSLPYAIEKLEIFLPCVASMWAVIHRRVGQGRTGALATFDLDLCDDMGAIRVRIRGFAARVLRTATEPRENVSLLLHVPHWEARPVDLLSAAPPTFERHIVVCCGLEPSICARLKADQPHRNVSWIDIGLKGKNLAKDFHDAVLKTFVAIRSIIEARPAGDSLLQVLMAAGREHLAHSGLVGLLRTAQLEFPRLRAQLIQMDAPSITDGSARILQENAALPDDTWVRYCGGRRELTSWNELVSPKQAYPWKSNGIYLITGGLGGLGRIFAEEIAKRAPKATLVLAGRAEPREDAQRSLENLRERGANVKYRQVDLRQRENVKTFIQSLLEAHGGLHGILHTAGVLRDEYLLRKTVKDIELVLGPKVTGTVNLDEATRDVALDFFVLFSSGATLGNAGQGDYAAANAFLDGFARYRNELVNAGTRRGRTLSIAWPFWKEGGMRMDAAALAGMKEHAGLVAMETATGLEAFNRCLASGHPHILVLNGVASRIRTALAPQPRAPRVEPAVEETQSAHANGEAAPAGSVPEAELRASLTEYLKGLICETLKIQPAEMQAEKDLYGYGLDSIIALEVNNRLERDFPRLSKTLFFEYATIQELAGFFLQAHRQTVERMFRIQATPPSKRSLDLTKDSEGGRLQARNGEAALPDGTLRAAQSAEIAHPNGHEPAGGTLSESYPKRPASLDEVIRTLKVEIIHPAPRPSDRLRQAGEWPNWHSLFQSFAVFDAIQPAFSFSRMLAGASASPADAALFLQGQIDVRRILFRREDFNQVSRIVDLGCGRAADLIELTLSHPGLKAHGLTIDEAEAHFANRVIRRKGLAERVQVILRDSTGHEFERDYDLAFSIQVMHFIPDLERKRRMFRNIASALRENGILVMAEFVSLLAKPMRDPALNTTVHSVREWAELLGGNGLILQEVVDLSGGIVHFLQDPDLEKHVVGLDAARQLEIRKYNRQITGLENRWVSYCAMRVLKDHRQKPAQQLVRDNLERFNERTSIRQAWADLHNGRPCLLYGDLIEHFQDCVAPASHGFPALFHQGN